MPNRPVANNVTRLLDTHKVSYQAFVLSAEKHSALDTAELLGVPPEIVFKTIVVTCEKPAKPALVVIPGNREVDLKKVAAFLHQKKVHLPTQREAEQMTGLQAGGISPLALLNRGFQILLDATAQNHAEIHISGGQRGLNIRLPVQNLVDLTQARIADLTTSNILDNNPK